MKKLTVLMFIVLAAFTTSVFAASLTPAQKKQVTNYTKQLKALPKAGASAAKVNAIVNRLAKLDPKKAAAYIKTAATKLAPTAANQKALAKMAASVNKILQKSDLSKAQIAKLTKQVNAVATNFKVAATGPTPDVNTTTTEEDNSEETTEDTDADADTVTTDTTDTSGTDTTDTTETDQTPGGTETQDLPRSGSTITPLTPNDIESTSPSGGQGPNQP